MCYAASCNPLCGDCRPKRIVQARCPSCGFTNEMSRDEYLALFELPHKKGIADQKIAERGGVAQPVCIGCGEDLLEAFRVAVEPADCLSNRVVCGFPCGRRYDPYREDARPCPTMVPLGKITARE
ncbi:MAG: hypothetical protein IJ111_06955 [Eggerthellaceae bacterium]|nr:hypothetical protein [Eggerthellaceae bacterium]